MKNVESGKAGKQRKFHSCKPMHRKQQGLAGHLSKQLREKLGVRSVPLRKGDTVKVLRGKKRGGSGKIIEVNYARGSVFVEKVTRKKANGEDIPVPLHASNLLVTELDRNDAKRFKGKKKES